MTSHPAELLAADQIVLAIDIGTSSVRALISDQTGTAIMATESQLSYRLETSRDGTAVFNAESLLDILIQAIDDTLRSLPPTTAPFVAVGVTSFWHSLLGLDRDGNPLTPIYYWADSRSDDTLASLASRLDAEPLRQRTGCRLHSSYWPAKLHWLRTTQPDLYASVTRWVSFTEYASRKLSQSTKTVMSISMASGTGLIDVHRLIWDDELLTVLNISPDSLPTLVDADHRANLNDHFSLRWPPLRDVPWFPALGDGACANVGSAAVGPARIALTLGTSGAMRVVLPAPAGSSWLVPTGLWAYRLDRGHAVLGGALSNGGNFRRWIAELTGLAVDENSAAIAAQPADGHGLTMLPFVAGERSPGWHADATGVITGLTLATTPTDLARAAMESVAYRFAQIYASLRPIVDPAHEIIANGGAVVSSPEWTEIIASALGHDVLALPAGDESTARGAALMALRSVGVLPSLRQVPDLAVEATRFAPSAADHERYRAAQSRQQALEILLYPNAGSAAAPVPSLSKDRPPDD